MSQRSWQRVISAFCLYQALHLANISMILERG
jgi:hypothetical protein